MNTYSKLYQFRSFKLTCLHMLSLTSKADLNALIFVPLTWTIISETELISSLGDIFLEFEKKSFCSETCIK